MSDDTAADETAGVVEPTEVIEADATTVLAWSNEADDEETTQAFPAGASNKPVIGVAVLAMIACGIAAVAAVVALSSPKPLAQHFTIRPAPVEQVPAPPIAPPPAPKAVAPPVQAPKPRALPNAHEQFAQALRGDTANTVGGNGLHPTEAPEQTNSEGMQLCRDIRSEGEAAAIKEWTSDTLKKSPSLSYEQAREVVLQAQGAYC